MKTRIIVLDIDGVLCTRRSHLAYGKEGGIWFEWDPLAVAALKRALEAGKPYIKLVISSTWRKPENVKDLMRQLDRYALSEYLHVDWATPIRPNNLRGDEIDRWLHFHPDVESYVILDDVDEMLEGQKKFLILTDSEDGMTSDNIKCLLNWAGALKA